MKCPSCNETLVMTERQGVEIDYCPKCRGVWLDKGELDKIIERAAGEQQGNTSKGKKQWDDDDDDDNDLNRKGGRRKGGFLGDLFDFG